MSSFKETLNAETVLPDASSKSFWLKGAAWQFPDYENVDTFIERFVREDILVHDPLINAALHGQPTDVSPRTLRHRFAKATGQRQGYIVQYERAQHAKLLLEQGTSIPDTVYEAGYYDQPHLTRSLKQFFGYTPAQFSRTASSFKSS